MNTDWNDLIQRYIAGHTTEEETHRLETALKADDTLADLYLRHIELDLALEVKASSAEVMRELLTAPVMPETRHGLPWLSWRPLTAAAACLALWMIAGWLMRPALIVEVVSVSGREQWLSENEVPRVLKAGDWLPAGRIEMVSEDALLRLRFTDGTEVEFSGLTEADVSDYGQKIIRMASGLLSAKVKPQAQARPMRVLTPAAAVDVLGTIFTLDAAADVARLSVEEGRVRLRRLVDQQVTEVAAEHSVVASLDASAALTPARLSRPPQQWSAAFDPQRERITGKVTSASATRSSHAAAVAKLVTDPMKDGPQVVHWRVQVAPARQESSALASLAEDAVLEVRWRSAREVVPQIVLRTFRARSGFRGGFTARLETSSPPDADGWRLARVPIHALEALKPELGTSPLGLDVLAFELTTLEENAGLEVAGMSLR